MLRWGVRVSHAPQRRLRFLTLKGTIIAYDNRLSKARQLQSNLRVRYTPLTGRILKTKNTMKKNWTSTESVAALKQMIADRIKWEQDMRSLVDNLDLSPQQ